MKETTKKLYITIFCIVLAAFIAIVAVFIALGNGRDLPITYESGEYCNVVLMENKNFTSGKKVKKIKTGEDVTFTLTTKNGYTFDSVNYEDYEYTVHQPNLNGERQVDITLKNVKYSKMLEVKLKETNKLININLVESDLFSCQNEILQSVDVGSSVTYRLSFEEGYAFDGCSYANYEFLDGETYDTLTLKNVREQMQVEVWVKFMPEIDSDSVSVPTDTSAITYVLNGGSMIDDSNDFYYSVIYPQQIYSRVNTDTAIERIKRDGYVLTGWNTQADGSGTHIGLGSRCNVILNQAITLYAQWSKITDDNYFEYVLIDTEDISSLYLDNLGRISLSELVAFSDSEDVSAVITKYNGTNDTKITFPEVLDGYSVVGIATNAVKDHDEIQTVVINPKMKFLQDYSFSGCDNLKEVYLFDNIERTESQPFGEDSKVETLYINAVEPPVYGDIENGQFANKMEMLINYNSSRPKLVFFGGCSILYGLDSSNIQLSLYGRYSVFNMGLIGGTCATFQLDLIYQYMTDGDALVHIPELASLYQLLADRSFDSRCFVTIENNYDLLTSLNIMNYDKVFSSFNYYLIMKETTLEEGDYSNAQYIQRLDTINEYGDLIKDRLGDFDNEGEVYEFLPVREFRQSSAAEGMKEYYGKFAEKGVDVYYMFAAVNQSGLAENVGEDLVQEIFNTFETYDIPITPLMTDLNEVKMHSSFFYDTNYHLSMEGRRTYTEILIQYLIKILES